MTPQDNLMLGRPVPLPQSPNEAMIECVPAPDDNYQITTQYMVRLSCPEFTALCPQTGQPDFAHIVIDYVPRDLLIESKSLKLFMGSFRNHGSFHEHCTCLIGGRLFLAAKPIWLRVNAYWFPRGGIPIDIFWERGTKPPNLNVPPIEIPVYRAR